MNDSVARYTKLVAQYPENELARFSLGKAWYDAGEFARAKEQLALALARKPDWIVALMLAGKCDLALGNPAAAKGRLETARKLVAEEEHEGPLEEIESALNEVDQALAGGK